MTLESVQWAFTAVVAGNWAPVTLLSHMLCVQLFGLNSGMHHLVNVLIHALATVLLFAVFIRATRRTWPSAFVAFIFALHPLHVESVAWVSERKDVLSAVFFFGALYLYVRYTEGGPRHRTLYLAMLAAFCLGFMSKASTVTFPLVCVLFDIWPLRRVASPKVVWEKIPLLAISVIGSFVTYSAQRSAGAVSQALSLAARVFNGLLSYGTYLYQTVWPSGLVMFYPYPRVIFAQRSAVALLVLAAITALVVYKMRTRPYAIMGWVWFFVTMGPMIGLVQAGAQSHADRYTYIPMVGLSVMVAWAVADLVAKWPTAKTGVTIAAAIVCAACMVMSWIQVGYWRNGQTLYLHAIQLNQDNWVAHGSLGLYYLDEIPGHRTEAIEELTAAVRSNPDDGYSHYTLGFCLAQAGQCIAAIPHFEEALRSYPKLAMASDNLGRCLAEERHYEAAIPHLQKALVLDPNLVGARFNLGLVLAKIPGLSEEAMHQFEMVLALAPDHHESRENLGLLLLQAGRDKEAIAQLEAALRLHPDATLESLIDRTKAGSEVKGEKLELKPLDQGNFPMKPEN